MKYCRSSQSRRRPEEEKWERHLIQGQANMRNPFPEFTTEELWSTSIHKSKEIVELVSNMTPSLIIKCTLLFCNKTCLVHKYRHNIYYINVKQSKNHTFLIESIKCYVMTLLHLKDYIWARNLRDEVMTKKITIVKWINPVWSMGKLNN